MDMTSFLQGIAPRATNQLLQSSSPRGSPRAHGWTERPRRSTPSARDGQDVRTRRAKLYLRARHHEAVMAGATEMDGRDEEKFLVVLRFVFTPSAPTPYVTVLCAACRWDARARVLLTRTLARAWLAHAARPYSTVVPSYSTYVP